jgi:hypothetical protein
MQRMEWNALGDRGQSPKRAVFSNQLQMSWLKESDALILLARARGASKAKQSKAKRSEVKQSDECALARCL